MGRFRNSVIAGLAVALGAGGAVGAQPAQAVNPGCKVDVSVDRYIELEVQPQITVALTGCGSGQLTVDVRSSEGTTSIPVGSVNDGETNVWAGVDQRGSYSARARVDNITTGWKDFSLINWPTANTAGWKFVNQGTSAWGTFDVGQAIRVWSEVRIGNRWSKSQEVRSNANGYYTVPLTYGAGTPGVYSFRIAGQYPNGQIVYSDYVWLERLARPTASSAGIKAVGETTNVWGTFDAAPSSRVWTEVWNGSRWVRSQTRTVNSNGSYTIPLTYGVSSKGTTRWRVAGSIDQNTVARTSEFTLRRVGAPSAATAGSARVGAAANVWGTFDSGGKPMTVWTEVWNGKEWSRSQSRTTTASGGYVIPLTYGQNNSGTTRWRVVGRYAEGNVQTKEFTLTRR